MLLLPNCCCCCCSIAQLCLTLCDPMDCSLPGSSVHGILQARILEWVTISSSRGSSQPRDQTLVTCGSCVGRRILYHCATWEAPEETGMRTNRKLRALVVIHPVGSSSLKTNWYCILKTPALVAQPLPRWSLSCFPGASLPTLLSTVYTDGRTACPEAPRSPSS